jgi:hypothetical protein
METLAMDFVPWGLEAAWPSRCWIEPVYGRPQEPLRGIRLGHASDAAMVLTCTFPRDRFDAEVAGIGADPLREIAFEATFALINLALHQIRVPGARPEGLVGSLVRFANQQANRYQDWAVTHWGLEEAAVIGMAGWQSGFSLAYPDVYVIVHACGIGIDKLRLQPVDDISGYELTTDPLELGAMHWELWRSEPPVGYEDLARVLVAR